MTETSASSLVRAGRALSLGGAGLGLLGLAGWLLDVDALTTFVAGRPAMMPNTALTLVAMGACAALRSTRPGARGSAIITGALALLTFVIGFATVAEYALGRDFGIDQLLIPVASGVPYPGRPSPLTGAALTFLGLAALPPPRRARLAALAQWLTLAAMFVAFVVIVGHLFGAGVVYELRTAPVTGVAVPTALALLLISFGMLLSDRNSTLTALLASSSPGGFLLRRLGLAVVLAIPTLGVLSFRAMSRAGIDDIPLILAVLTTAGVPLALSALVFTAGRLDRAHVELESNRERARLLVEDSADAIFVADLAGRYTDVNAAGCRLLGFAKEEIVGKTILDFILRTRASGSPLRGNGLPPEWPKPRNGTCDAGTAAMSPSR